MIKYNRYQLRDTPINTLLTLTEKLHLAAQNVALLGFHYGGGKIIRANIIP